MTYRSGVSFVTLIALAGLACGDSTGPTAIDNGWSGVVAQGYAVEIKGINGDIIATTTSSSSVTVLVSKTGTHSDPAEVEIEVITHSDGVTICAVYPNLPGEPVNECAPGDGGRMNIRENDVEVTFHVALPPGVDLIGKTINGSVRATDVRSNVFANTMNGDVQISTSEIATGYTINGSIRVSIGLTEWDRDLQFATVNGNASVSVPQGTNADVHLTTVNGVISADMTVSTVSAGNLRGVLGRGGRALFITTINGNVELERGS